MGWAGGNQDRGADSCGSKDSLLASITSQEVEISINTLARRRPSQRRATRVRDILVSEGPRVCHWSKFDWLTPDKSTLSSISTTLSIHLHVTVFVQPNSQPESRPALQNISVPNLSARPHRYPQLSISLPQPGLSKAGTSPQSRPKPIQARGRKWWSRFRSPHHPPALPFLPHCPSGRV